MRTRHPVTMHGGTALGAVALLASTVFSISATSQQPSPEPFVLFWNAPAPCPSAEQMTASIRELIGTQAHSGPPITTRAEAYRGEDGAWHVQIETQTPEARGERKVDGGSCKVVSDAAVLIIAMAVDPDAVAAHLGATALAPSSSAPVVATSPPPPAASSSPSPAASVRPPVPVLREPVPSEPKQSWLRGGSVSGGAVLDFGTLPEPAPGWELALGLRSRAYRVELSVRDFRAIRHHYEQPARAGGEFDLWAAGVAGCREWTQLRFSYAGCVGVEAGVLSARGFGVSEPSKASPPWIAASASALGNVRLWQGFFVRAQLGLLVPFTRKAFVIQPYDQLHRASPVGLRVSAGPAWQFP